MLLLYDNSQIISIAMLGEFYYVFFINVLASLRLYYFMPLIEPRAILKDQFRYNVTFCVTITPKFHGVIVTLFTFILHPL